MQCWTTSLQLLLHQCKVPCGQSISLHRLLFKEVLYLTESVGHYVVFSEQPPAFWNNPEYLHLIREEIKKLKLPTPEMKHATVSG